MGQVITVATLKGGSGKSTLAACLAVQWQQEGRAPIIIDADPQRSIARLALREKALGGVEVIENPLEDCWKAARDMAHAGRLVIVDTPGFRSAATLSCTTSSDFLLIPVKPSPMDLDRMLDTVSPLLGTAERSGVFFRCVLTQTVRESVIAKHIRQELSGAGFPLLKGELVSRVCYAEAALWGATPTLLDPKGAAARDIAEIASEIDQLCRFRLAA